MAHVQGLEVSKVHSESVENNCLTAYSHPSCTVHISGRQRFANGYSTASQWLDNGYSLNSFLILYI